MQILPTIHFAKQLYNLLLPFYIHDFIFLLLRPFIFNLLVYETGDRIFSKSGKKNKNPNCRFLFLPMVEKT